MNIKELYELYSKNYLVDTDTRLIRKGAMFFALKGETFNGNKFAKDALRSGASYAIIDDESYEVDNRTILVDDVLTTLQELAKYHRKVLGIPVVALTGSNGKTTTKELINAVLAQKYKVYATKGNLNNHIGVPLTLLAITQNVEIAVVEMGANHHKEIAFLSNLVNPDYGFITNFGKAHLEGFGSVQGVIEAKSELYDYLREHNKTAIVNSKDAIQMEKTNDIHRILFDESLSYINAAPYVNLSFNGLVIHSNLIGNYNFNNICAAITIGKFFNVSDSDIKEAIELYVPSNNRSEVIERGNVKILLDAYNANPTSMECSIRSFSELSDEVKVVVLGDMFELGENSKEEHQKIVELVEELGFDKAYVIGENFYKTETTLAKFLNFDDFKRYLEMNSIEDGTVLIKGSRGMALERVLDLV